VGDPSRTEELTGWLVRLTVVLGIALLWPVSYTLWPKRPEARSEPT
jgi:hypothetical protein